MSKLILHVGTHKTGSTAIQDRLYWNRIFLRQNGFIYPNIGPNAGHHWMVTDWVHLPDMFQMERSTQDALKTLVDKYADTDATVFLSTEELSRSDPKQLPDLVAIRKMLDGFDQVQVVCVFRHQINFIQAVYTEISKDRAPPTTPQILVQQALKTEMVTGLAVDYHALYKRLQTAFPKDELVVLDYVKTTAHPDGLVGGVLDACGHADLIPKLKTWSHKKTNVSANPLLTWIGDVVARPRQARPFLLGLIERSLRGQFPDKTKYCVLTREQVQKIMNHFSPKNETLSQDIKKGGRAFDLSTPDFEKTVLACDLEDGFWVYLSREMYDHVHTL